MQGRRALQPNRRQALARDRDESQRQEARGPHLNEGAAPTARGVGVFFLPLLLFPFPRDLHLEAERDRGGELS